ncbi:hypothetical protein AVEN_207147-1 [Araneus ventricosus]|uniref:Uncharacterized protein n=1 Tax=Araneus ventricosus TaxID=182803 RepID=A0A4Y2RUY2_ARAVE|nr:hypothetical protein AVEN_145821-1 [Araneus ventricosus]GBN79069.1 hypothetical protein AVEN_207147-1 [Araneus ventricosus]
MIVKDSQASTPDLESEPIIVGAWVAVVYDENWFPGLIEEINDDNLKLHAKKWKPILLAKYTRYPGSTKGWNFVSY